MQTNHYQQDLLVIIKKPKIRIADNYGAFISYLREGRAAYSTYNAFLSSLKTAERNRLNSAFVNKILVEYNPSYFEANSDTNNTMFDGAFGYYYIVAGGAPYDKDNSNYLVKDAINKNKTITNNLDRVMSVQITTTVTGASSCNITIDNTDNKFFLQSDLNNDIFNTMDCLIEPMDEVVVYIKEKSNKYRTVFTGYVNSVTDKDDGNEQRIEVTCEDVTKKSSITRTNVNPSLDAEEAEGNAISIYNENYTSLEPTEVLRNILARTYCDLFNNPTLCNELSDVFWIKTNNNITYKVGEDKTAQLNETQTLIGKYVDIYTEYIYNKTTKKLQKIIGYKALPTDGLRDRDGSIITTAQTNPKAFEITGLDQDLYAWQLNSNYDLMISDWKGNDQIIQDLADKAFFEYFADVNGVIYFRPKNLTLPNSAQDSMVDEIKDNYWLTTDKEHLVRNFSKTINDRELFTDIVVNGQYVIQAINHALMKKLVISYKNRRKYGVRMMPQETRPGITTTDGMEVFGRNRLTLANSKFTSASLSLNGNPAIKPGMPLFIERWLSIYYIESVSHNWTAGSDYSTTLNLNYKRKPISRLSTFKSTLTELVKIQELADWEVVEYNKDKDMLLFGYTPNPTLPTNDYYVWERIPVRMSVLEAAASQTSIDAINKEFERINKDNNLPKDKSQNNTTIINSVPPNDPNNSNITLNSNNNIQQNLKANNDLITVPIDISKSVANLKNYLIKNTTNLLGMVTPKSINATNTLTQPKLGSFK